jgi:NitT/TauT family transport system substrate-binding protein
MPYTSGRSRRLAVLVAGVALICAWFAGISGAQARQDELVRIGTLRFGSVNWEAAVIRRHGLDRKHGVKLAVQEFAGKDAAAVALQAGAVDVILTDWIWAAVSRRQGSDFVFVPHTGTVGAIMVPAGSDIRSLADLKGKKLGIAGGALDKNWLLVRAYIRRTHGFDPAGEAVPVFAAPPLLNAIGMRGDVDAVLNFWQYNARLEAQGMRELVRVEDLLPAFGLNAPPPLLGWVFRESWARAHPIAIDGFLAAAHKARLALAASDEEWTAIRPLTGAEDDAVFLALRRAYRRGVGWTPPGNPVAEAETLLKIIAEFGGPDVAQLAQGLPKDTFWNPVAE